MLSLSEIETEINQTEADYKHILIMTPQEIGADFHLNMQRSTAIGMLKKLYKVAYGTERPEYPCMIGWEEELARLGVEPWASRGKREQD